MGRGGSPGGRCGTHQPAKWVVNSGFLGARSSMDLKRASGSSVGRGQGQGQEYLPEEMRPEGLRHVALGRSQPVLSKPSHNLIRLSTPCHPQLGRDILSKGRRPIAAKSRGSLRPEQPWGCARPGCSGETHPPFSLLLHSLTSSRRKAPFGAHAFSTPASQPQRAPFQAERALRGPHLAGTTSRHPDIPCGLIVPTVCPFYPWQVRLVFHLH